MATAPLRHPRTETARAPLRLGEIIGVGDRIMAVAAPFVVVGLAANVLWPWLFRMGWGEAGRLAGFVLVAIGVPLWLTAVVQILVSVPRRQLATTGPFAFVLHPIYTSVALLVMPGCGVLFDSWLGFALGAVVYLAARHFERSEEEELATRFPDEYPAYRARVLLPWL